jgi:hypothetical protein
MSKNKSVNAGINLTTWSLPLSVYCEYEPRFCTFIWIGFLCFYVEIEVSAKEDDHA